MAPSHEGCPPRDFGALRGFLSGLWHRLLRILCGENLALPNSQANPTQSMAIDLARPTDLHRGSQA